MGTQALWNIYPTTVRHWINRHGGLSRKMIFLQGGDAAAASCASCASPRARTPAGALNATPLRAAPPVRYVRAPPPATAANAIAA